MENKVTKPKSKVVFFTLFGLSTAVLLATPVIALGWIGFFLDQYFKTSPLLLFVLAGIGCVGGIINVMRLLKTVS